MPRCPVLLPGRRETQLSRTETLKNPAGIEAEFEALVEFLYLTPVGIVKFRPNGRIDMANPEAARLLMPLAADSDMADIYRLLGKLVPDLRERIEAFRPPAGPICDQLQLAIPGTVRVLTLGVNKIDNDTLMAVLQDISVAIEHEKRIRVDQQRLHAIFENIRDYAIYTVDLDGRIDEWNRSLYRLGGWQAHDLAAASIAIFFGPANGHAVAATMLQRARQHGTAEFEGWGVRKDDSVFWGNTVATALPDRDGRAGGFVLVTRDLTERKHFEDRLVALAATDPLTGAANRRAGDAHLEQAFRQWQRVPEPFCVLMVDCDHFKNVNDTWGHDAGDQVLVALVRICRDKMRGADVAIRWGGEEFLLLLQNTRRDAALAVAERVRTAIAETHIDYDATAIRITVSIGVAEVRDSDEHAGDVVRRADQSLYRAKQSGRNRVLAN